MSQNDEIVYEPNDRRRKYRVSGKSRSLDYRHAKHWLVLLSVSKLGDVPEDDPPGTPSPLAGGHKPSFKGGSNKLAKRARSFKDDFLGKISQMRSPQGAAGAARSPRGQSPKAGTGGDPGRAAVVGRGPAHDLDELRKQIQVALKHFRDVVYKQKLEMLPGNGTIVLDTVWQINLAVKSAENSNNIRSATLRMYECVARLIKLCDDVLIDDKSSELDMENVNDIVQQVEDAVKNLINLAQEKLTQQHLTYKTAPRSSYCSSLEMPAQRNSLPDIPLTPKEREILEHTSYVTPVKVRNSHSTESILRDSSPPPKPPLPERLRLSQPDNCITPPPLPPKKKNVRMQQLVDEGFYNNSPKSNGCERISQRSKSPDDSISLQSESVGSLDSVLNCSREEDEMKELMDHDNMFIENHTSDILGANGTNLWEESCLAGDSFTSSNDYHRLSNADSGFASSVRSSGYSQTSTTSSQFVQHVKKQTNIESGFRSNVITNFSQSSSSSSSSVVMMSNSVAIGKEELPPAIPEKTKKKTERQPSPYDNVPEQKMGELLITCQRHQSHHSLSNSLTITNNWEQESNEPPPLPPKKKHIMAYMEMFGNCSHTSNQEFLRHSVHMVHAQYGPPVPQGLPTARSCAFGRPSRSYSTAAEDDRSPSPPRTPHPSNALPPALPPKQRSRKSSARSPPPTPTSFPPKPPPSPSSKPPPPHLLPDLLEHTTKSEGKSSHSPHFPSSPDSSPSGGGSPSPSFEVDLMEELDVERFLLKKKENEEGPDIRGGPIDALIIQATKATKNGVFIYQEAFLTTYRTFISPKELIMKLIRRYNHFYYVSDKKPRSREAFALIVRVVSDLTTLDLDEDLQLKLMNFVQQLISCGELTLAKALRVKHLQRHEAKQGSLRHPIASTAVTLNCSGSRNATSLLEFKSEQIAEQMTLLDAELFMKIEIPEVLMWAQEQNEERSPNLTRFTEHFNKMSYWARTRILTAEGRDAREKYFSKFIKIMKHLRKINNFNSYLALLSALDSAPVRRLEWQKQVQEGLKDYCALIDSSSSFRAYRMALAETQPPCIPYIGLILQDLTFVHIGNTDLLSEGNINFSKRWQQFNILENMKKFKKETYTFKKQERIISFFDNFSDFIGEEDMWKLSETIKPRGKKTPH